MTSSPFLNSLPEPYQSFCSESLDCYHTLTYICVLWLLFLIFCFLVAIPSTQTFWENEHTQTLRGRGKARRKGCTHKGCRYHQREEEEEKILISILKSPLGQRHDSTCFRQLLCPDPSCEMCNNATSEMDQLLSSLFLEDATPSMSPLASTAPVTEPSFTLSPAFSAVPPGDLTPPPLPESLPAHSSVLSPNPVTLLDDFPTLSLLSSPTSLPPDPFPPLESEFLVDSPPQPLPFPSLPPHDTQNETTALTLNVTILHSSITQDLNPSPDLAQTLNPAASLTSHVPQTLSVSPPLDPNLTATQPKSTSTSSKPTLGKTSLDSTGALSTSVSHGTDHPSLSVSDCSWQDACVKDSLPSTLARCDSNQDKEVGYDSEKDLDNDRMGLSGENSLVSEQSVRQTQLENALKVHLSKKLEEINEGRLPGIMHSSWHVIQHFPLK